MRITQAPKFWKTNKAVQKSRLSFPREGWDPSALALSRLQGLEQDGNTIQGGHGKATQQLCPALPCGPIQHPLVWDQSVPSQKSSIAPCRCQTHSISVRHTDPLFPALDAQLRTTPPQESSSVFLQVISYHTFPQGPASPSQGHEKLLAPTPCLSL